jgi:hypothetical protein
MTRATATFKINVTAAPPAGAVPALGAAKLIGASDGHQSVMPAGMNAVAFTEALFEAYGCGAFVRDYSTDGAFIVANSGGHNHYEIVGGAGFDFTTRSWFWRGTPGYTEKMPASAVADTNGSPYYELTAAAAQTPAPPHPYGNMHSIRAADGGGAKGSIIHIGRAAVCQESVSSSTAHKFDCSTGVWSRAATGTFTHTGLQEGFAVFDPVTKRYYSVGSTSQHAASFVSYLNVADWTWKTLSGIGYATPGDSTYASALSWAGNGKRLLMLLWGSTWQALDLDYPAAGWQTISHTGVAISPAKNAPCWHEGNGNLYWRAGTGAGRTLVKVVPPANPLAGTWVKSTVTLSGDTIPEFKGSSVTTEHYKSLFYIPSLGMLGWVTAFGVALLNPN